jgi:hypothetical protein
LAIISLFRKNRLTQPQYLATLTSSGLSFLHRGSIENSILFRGVFIMAKISKSDANPLVAALLCLILNLGHWIINGQQKKWLMILIATFVGMLLCCIPGWIVAIAGIIDAYKTAEKLKAGKEIDENEYSVKLLYSIVKIIHKDAVFVE